MHFTPRSQCTLQQKLDYSPHFADRVIEGQGSEKNCPASDKATKRADVVWVPALLYPLERIKLNMTAVVVWNEEPP